METAIVSKKESMKQKMREGIDKQLFNQLSESLKNIKAGRLRRVK